MGDGTIELRIFCLPFFYLCAKGKTMSRVVWGTGKAAPVSDGKKQTTLESFGAKVVVKTEETSGRKRPREGDEHEEKKDMMKMSPQEYLQNQPDDAVCWGPSGGGDRESQGRRRPRPFMNGKERNLTFDEASPYSRTYIAAWREQLTAGEKGRFAKPEVKAENGIDGARPTQTASVSLTEPTNTNFDEELLLEPYLAKNCPRTVFQGKTFFLNSCDRDPLVTTYMLEKLIRYLGGQTSMGPGGHVAYIVTQHLSSAKENRLLGQEGKVGKKKTTATKYIHPHFVLECAKQGKLVAETPFRTVLEASSKRPDVVGMDPSCHTQRKQSKLLPTSTTTVEEHVLSSDDDDVVVVVE